MLTPEGTWEAHELGQLIDTMLAGSSSTSPPKRHRVVLEARTLAKDGRLAVRHLRGGRTKLPYARDIAVLTARDAGAFHDFPPKLREYPASGRAIISPVGGQPVGAVTYGADGLQYEPGHVPSLARHLGVLTDDPARGRRLGQVAREDEISRGGAAAQIDVALHHLVLAVQHGEREEPRWR